NGVMAASCRVQDCTSACDSVCLHEPESGIERLAMPERRRRRNMPGGSAMTINIRRVVTGHDAHGKAVVRIDDVGAHVGSGRPHMTRQLIWTTNDLPVHFAEDGDDKGAREIGTTIK